MIYAFEITTSANTAQVNEDETKLFLTAGVVHQLDILFPTGCAGLAYIKIHHGGHQLWPLNVNTYFHTDGETISFKEFYHLKTAPFELMAYTYNLDDTYDHTVYIRIGVLKQSEVQGIWLPWSDEEI